MITNIFESFLIPFPIISTPYSSRDTISFICFLNASISLKQKEFSGQGMHKLRLTVTQYIPWGTGLPIPCKHIDANGLGKEREEWRVFKKAKGVSCQGSDRAGKGANLYKCGGNQILGWNRRRVRESEWRKISVLMCVSQVGGNRKQWPEILVYYKTLPFSIETGIHLCPLGWSCFLGTKIYFPILTWTLIFP